MRRVTVKLIDKETGEERMTLSVSRSALPDALRARRIDPERFLLVGASRNAPETPQVRSLRLETGGDKDRSPCFLIVVSSAFRRKGGIIGGGELVWYEFAKRLRTRGFGVHFVCWQDADYGVSNLPVTESRRETFEGMIFHVVPPEGAVDYAVALAQERRPLGILSSIHWETWFNARLPELASLVPLLIFQQFWQGLENGSQYQEIPETARLNEDAAELFAAAAVCAANSDFTRRRFEHATGLPFRVMTPPTADALGESSRDGEILLVGAGWEKGLHLFADVSRKFPEERFLILGEPEREWTANCHSVGWADARPFYSRAKALLAPSEVCESYGMAVVEAGKWGIPTVVSDNGALAENSLTALPTFDVSKWAEATGEILKGNGKVKCGLPTRRKTLRQFDGAIQELTMRGETEKTFPAIGTYAPPGYWSCYNVSETLAARFGLASLNRTPVADVSAVLLHAWHEDYPARIQDFRKRGVRVYGVLHSPAAQGELDGESEPFEMLLANGVENLLVCHAPLAATLGSRWFPTPTNTDELLPFRRGVRELGDEIHVGLFNTRGSRGWRKNVWTQVLACRELALISARKVVIHSPRPADGILLAFAGDCEYVQESLPIRADYLKRLSEMDVTFQVTHAESFNFTAVESVFLGVPCIFGSCAPAGRFGMEDSLVVDDATNPIAIAQKAWAAVQDAQAGWWQERMMMLAEQMLRARDAALISTLNSVAGDMQ